MKRRYLKPQIQKTLEVITFVMVMLMAMVDDFSVNLPTLAFFGAWVGIIALNATVLNKYGKY